MTTLKRFSEYMNESSEVLDEVSREKLTSYIRRAQDDPKRSAGVNLALRKKWGDPNYGFKDNPKVPGGGKWPKKIEENNESPPPRPRLVTRLKDGSFKNNQTGEVWHYDPTGKKLDGPRPANKEPKKK